MSSATKKAAADAWMRFCKAVRKLYGDTDAEPLLETLAGEAAAVDKAVRADAIALLAESTRPAPLTMTEEREAAIRRAWLSAPVKLADDIEFLAELDATRAALAASQSAAQATYLASSKALRIALARVAELEADLVKSHAAVLEATDLGHRAANIAESALPASDEPQIGDVLHGPLQLGSRVDYLHLVVGRGRRDELGYVEVESYVQVANGRSWWDAATVDRWERFVRARCRRV